ncbi:MAG: hypothetical protein K2Q12_11430 [Rickettsiales bacterium]|nr:hypothetical protein [Rickettsiales bacterium]
MAEEFNLILEHLRHIRAKVDRIEDEQRLQGLRMSSLERHMSNFHNDFVTFRDEIDGVKGRLERIDHHLGLHDHEH